MASSDKYYNIAAGSVTLSAANTETSVDVDMPCDWRTKTMVLIHRVEIGQFANSPIIPSATGSAWQSAALMWTNSGLDMMGDEDVICSFKDFYTCDVVANETWGVLTQTGRHSWIFDKPIPVAQAKLYFVGNTTGQSAAQIFYYRIYFTTKTVGDKDWQEVLEARHGYTE